MDSDLDHPEQIGLSIRFAKTEKAIVPNLYGADTAVSESPMAVNNLHHVLNIADFRPFNAVAEWAGLVGHVVQCNCTLAGVAVSGSSGEAYLIRTWKQTGVGNLSIEVSRINKARPTFADP